MDCRTSWILVLGLAASCTGCMSSSAGLKAKTEVAFADFRVREVSTNRELSPARREADYERARLAYHRALEIDPGCKEAYAGLAHLYAAQGNEDAAAAAYQKALQKFPRDAGLWCDLGLCQCRRQDWKAAVEALQHGHALEPDNRACTRALGYTLARAGQPQTAVAMLSQVMGKAEAHYDVARMLHHMGKDEQSRQYTREALRLKPDLAGARELYARLDTAGRPSVLPAARLGANITFAAEGEARQ